MNLEGILISLALYSDYKAYFIEYGYNETNKYFLSIVHCNKDDGSNKKEEIYKVGDKPYILFDEFLADCIRFVKLHTEFLEKSNLLEQKKQECSKVIDELKEENKKNLGE